MGQHQLAHDLATPQGNLAAVALATDGVPTPTVEPSPIWKWKRAGRCGSNIAALWLLRFADTPAALVDQEKIAGVVTAVRMDVTDRTCQGRPTGKNTTRRRLCHCAGPPRLFCHIPMRRKLGSAKRQFFLCSGPPPENRQVDLSIPAGSVAHAISKSQPSQPPPTTATKPTARA
jgi:hypothetical protein